MTAEMLDHRDRWLEVLERFGVTGVTGMRAGGGTAAPKVVVDSPSGRFLVRTRRPAASHPDVVAYDHSVIEALAHASVPTPKPLVAANGRTWAEVGGVTYEAFPFVPGLSAYVWSSEAQLRSAATTLGKMHRATAAMTPAGSKPWPREHRLPDMLQVLRERLAEPGGPPAERDAARIMAGWAEELAEQHTAECVAALPHLVVHADYTPANVGFHGDAIGGVFDFDWVSRQARLLDVGEALQFFAFGRDTPLDPSSIWSLVQPWQGDLDRAAQFLAAYQAVQPLSEAEAQALPRFMQETWFGVRVRAMRKVAPKDQLRILTTGTLESWDWLRANAGSLAQAVRETAPQLRGSR